MGWCQCDNCTETSGKTQPGEVSLPSVYVFWVQDTALLTSCGEAWAQHGLERGFILLHSGGQLSLTGSAGHENQSLVRGEARRSQTPFSQSVRRGSALCALPACACAARAEKRPTWGPSAAWSALQGGTAR